MLKRFAFVWESVYWISKFSVYSAVFMFLALVIGGVSSGLTYAVTGNGSSIDQVVDITLNSAGLAVSSMQSNPWLVWFAFATVYIFYQFFNDEKISEMTDLSKDTGMGYWWEVLALSLVGTPVSLYLISTQVHNFPVSVSEKGVVAVIALISLIVSYRLTNAVEEDTKRFNYDIPEKFAWKSFARLPILFGVWVLIVGRPDGAPNYIVTFFSSMTPMVGLLYVATRQFRGKQTAYSVEEIEKEL